MVVFVSVRREIVKICPVKLMSERTECRFLPEEVICKKDNSRVVNVDMIVSL